MGTPILFSIEPHNHAPAPETFVKIPNAEPLRTGFISRFLRQLPKRVGRQDFENAVLYICAGLRRKAHFFTPVPKRSPGRDPGQM